MSEDSKELLKKCLIKLSLKSGFESFTKFRLYKENVSKCSEDYKSVFPEFQIISEIDDKIYVDNLKIMTAQNLYDSKTGEIIKINDKLSVSLGVEKPPLNWWVSEKWDGIRALWDGEKIISRGSGLGKPKVYTYVPEWFKLTLPPGIPLDGEIWIGRGMFQKTSRLSTLKPGKSYTLTEIDDIWSGKTDPPVLFKIFDIPNHTGLFEERMKTLQTIIIDRKKHWDKLIYNNKKIFPLQFTEQIKIKSMEQLINLYKKLTKEGAEGIMLRAPKSPYELRRSKYMLKYKIKEDAECIVREYIQGEGRLKGLLGSLKCEILINGKNSGKYTQIGTGFTDSQRENYINKDSPEHIPMGSIVSFSYMEMTEDGVPRHPVYRGIRDDIKKTPNVSVKEVKSILEKLMNKIITEKSQNWQFKVKFYKQALNILDDKLKLVTTEDYINELRKGGMSLKDEEEFKAKNGTWKSSIVQKINDILKYGEVDGITNNNELIAVENLTKIAGIGPANASKLYKENNIITIEDLKEVYKLNKKILNDKQLIGLIHHDDLNKRIPREEMNMWKEIMEDIFKDTIKELSIDDYKFELSGSYRRGKQDSGDVDVLISTESKSNIILDKYYDNLIKNKIIVNKNLISKGVTKIMAVAKIDNTFRHLDIFYYPKEVFPFSLLFTTGSKEFNITIRSHANKKGYSLNEKNLSKLNGQLVTENEYKFKIGKNIPENEEDIFLFLGFTYVDPINR